MNLLGFLKSPKKATPDFSNVIFALPTPHFIFRMESGHAIADLSWKTTRVSRDEFDAAYKDEHWLYHEFKKRKIQTVSSNFLHDWSASIHADAEKRKSLPLPRHNQIIADSVFNACLQATSLEKGICFRNVRSFV